MAKSRRKWILGGVLGLAGVLAGCALGPVPGNPLLVQPGTQVDQLSALENPLFVPQGPTGYALVFDHTFDTLEEYFPIKRSNRFDGLIETWPVQTAGYFDACRYGFYDHRELLESTLQTIRRYAVARITPDNGGGYLISLAVYKELEDLPRPRRANTGAAVFRTEQHIERSYEVVDPLLLTKGWIPIGQDCPLEQIILAKLKECL
jgi:hypothetical protein